MVEHVILLQCEPVFPGHGHLDLNTNTLSYFLWNGSHVLLATALPFSPSLHVCLKHTPAF